MELESDKIELLKILIPAIVTILGFTINFFVTKSSISREIDKKKSNIYLEKLIDIPEKLLKSIEEIIEIRDKKEVVEEEIKIFLEKMKDINYIVLTYGTKNSINIIREIQQHSYRNIDSTRDDFEIVVLYILLVCQLKDDVTGVRICPSSIYLILFKNGKNLIEKYRIYNNCNVKKLKLKNFLKI